jgi:hypothetical protein
VIDSKELERDAGAKPLRTFAHPAPAQNGDYPAYFMAKALPKGLESFTNLQRSWKDQPAKALRLAMRRLVLAGADQRLKSNCHETSGISGVPIPNNNCIWHIKPDWLD